MNRLVSFEDSLERLVLDVQARVLTACSQPTFERRLQESLCETASAFFSHAAAGDFAQPLGLYFATYRSFGKGTDERTRLVGEFLCFYLLAADVFDDIEDGDAEGKPFARHGLPVATNLALTLLVLGLDALGKAIECTASAVECTASAGEAATLLRVFNRVSLRAVSAQHLDLLGEAKTRAEVLQVHEGKTSSLSLLTECGALVAGGNPQEIETFRQLGAKLAQVAQIVDDVRDIFGKDSSSDLRSGKSTYPLACLRELVSEAEFAEYQATLHNWDPETGLSRIREFYYDSGVIDECAGEVETLRVEVHDLVAGLPTLRSEHRLLLQIVDTLAGTLYEPDEVPGSARVRAACGEFGAALANEARRFAAHKELWSAAELPALRPWHLPFFLFSPRERTIFYPDLDGLAAEVLPFFAKLLATTLDEAHAVLGKLAPFFLAHELVHARRFDLGLLSEDSWHEEIVANSLGLAYLEESRPALAQEVLAYAGRVLEATAPPEELWALADRLLSEARFSPRSGLVDYEQTAEGAAQLHAILLERLAGASVRGLAAHYLEDSALVAAE
jgi:geranylgeranyl pyrophosphate synthase